MAHLAEQLVGRAEELKALEDALERQSGAIELVGEPGIGKTRLLAELEAMADDRGCLVLSGSASELERDLPFWVFVDALDEYVRGLPPAVLEPLNGELDRVLSQSAGGLADERHRAHQAVRELLVILASRQPLVLMLDDLHWADPGSLELLGTLLRRPPQAPVLLALAVRPRQVPEKLLPSLERANRGGTLTRIELTALSRADAKALHGDAADSVYEESGGNPFYLQQLARSLGRTGQVPRDVTAALSEELALLGEDAHKLIRGAAVAGDPFVPELAAAAADLGEHAALDALDELLRTDLIRPTDVPRRFRFRHPLVRRAVYDGAPAGWRLGAHERAAMLLLASKGSITARAQHVERYAREGDLEAATALRDAGLAADPSAPASAAHWFAAALRLIPEGQERMPLLLLYGRAMAQTGEFSASRDALIEALALAPPDFPLRGRMISGCATMERLLGRHEEARRRVEAALDALPDRGNPEAVFLMVELAADAFFATDFNRQWEWSRKGLALAGGLGDPAILAACTAQSAIADACVGLIEDAKRHTAEAAAMVDALSDEQLAQRLDAALFVMGAELHLDRFARGREHGVRAMRIGRATGQGFLLPALVPALCACLEMLGLLDEGIEVIEGAIEGARLSGNRQALSLALMNRSLLAHAAGEIELALTCGEEALATARGVGNRMAESFASFALMRALLSAGEPARALATLVEGGGGEDLVAMPSAWRTGGFELLALAYLALGRHRDAIHVAERAAQHAEEVGLVYAAGQAARTAAAVALETGEPERAGALALGAAARFEAIEAPIHAATARLLAGRALAASGDRTGAIVQCERAAETFETCGAPKRRDEAERELRRLGRTIYRRSGASGLESLTARELEIARLVVDRQTNTQIAATLFLSKKTVETHLRNIFGKVGVSSRVELARAVERSDANAG
ncbi:helix-turn-helix transcriptional regulator [Solirubrobacter soli]|uniref:helix-turn-helix transcriptional regulator n=1 Tax=Solirubrobacter soli TaxID=363832 RepID=UPI0003F8EE84|nr:LuxR family transcriptional regulator [Solirubrobacter soli]